MTIKELLEMLDGCGLVVTDDDLIKEELKQNGYSLKDKIEIIKNNKRKVNK